jgi:DNA-binding CsgD family transcriptional regulator
VLLNKIRITNSSEILNNMLEGWLERGMRAIAFIGPDLLAPEKRATLHVYPSRYQHAADVMAASDAYGQDWRDNDSPNVAWVDTSRSESWLKPWMEMGCRSILRVGMDMPGGKQIEVFAAFEDVLTRPFVAEFVLDLLAAWSQVKRYVLTPLSGLTNQQLRVLNMSLYGLSARECAVSLGVTERTVNHHLATIQEKLGTQSKLESIAKAIWCGAI